MSNNFSSALNAWRDVLGDSMVSTDSATLKAASQTTFPVSHGIEGILQPSTTEQVQQCLRIANQFQVSLYPISAGKNWGLGSKVPPQPGCVLLDLRRMNRIHTYHSDLSYIVVEPGVTFYQVADFLRENGDKHYIAATGSSGHGSLIGNALERGDGIGRYGERIHSLAAMQVVLPDGDCIHTGFGALSEDNEATHTHAQGIGPALDGLFVQSNLGVVTRATFYLEPVPADLRLFSAELPDNAALAACANQFRELTAQGLFAGMTVFFWNSYKYIARDQRFPWASQTSTPLQPEFLKNEPPWRFSALLASASSILGDVQAQHVQKRLEPLGLQIECLGPEFLPADRISQFLAPSEDNVHTAYWRKPDDLPEHLDPDRDRCGIHWVCMAIPLDGELLAKVFTRCEAITLAHGFEPHIGAGIASTRSVHAFVSLMYDRDITGEDERAQGAHDALLDALTELGTPPYRLGIQSMPWLAKREARYARLISSLKHSFDPANILAPGRYDGLSTSPEAVF